MHGPVPTLYGAHTRVGANGGPGCTVKVVLAILLNRIPTKQWRLGAEPRGLEERAVEGIYVVRIYVSEQGV